MPKDTILVVEDDEDILHLLQFNLESSGYEVVTAMDGAQALAKARRHHPELVLLDLMLPGMDGFEVCKELKKLPETAKTPIIMLTARGEEVDRIVGLELGADDYVVKPFSPREIILRVKAILRRGKPEKPSRQMWKRDGLAVDMDAHRVEVDDEEIQLTATEFKLLAELIRSQGRVQTRDQLLNSVWGYEFDGYARTVDTHVRRLRQKLGAHAGLVETVRGVGYRFKE
ncbi:two component transcriptional regulator, winged helix family [Alkalidesulfovibrio alkalitolerans DSM 16529]|uniref:Phosphate regulon transcriptional regulatory protein PhoB n=1 Tax=Alkalidesulfovibrio alkalitolerans DSM 16529 TaxID=1121439 RepID=S7TEQ5_9BACT|nr:response regulator [Alkalidesulfovibrio alkalitolerans]EPR35075.1 two component transcriptional regulator, winged helix family [Alkalidesulfovibrio alkalitolerans DSM 16529]